MKTPRVSDQALHEAMHLDLGSTATACGGILIAKATLQDFFQRAALVTHPEGSRRYGGYVLRMNDDESEILGVSLYRPGYPVCRDCDGTGRQSMFDEGQWIKVPCQACSRNGHDMFDRVEPEVQEWT